MIEEAVQDSGSFGGLPLSLVVIVLLYFAHPFLALKILMGLVIAYGLTASIRFLYYKERPQPKKHTNVFEKIDASSFPSLHAMRAMLLAGMLSTVFVHPVQQSLIGVCVLLTCYSRVHTEKHHVSDVVAGVALGALIVLGLRYF